MQKKDYTGVTPEQYDGGKIDTTSSTEFQSVEEAKAFYRVAKIRLLTVNEWQKLAGKLLAKFELTNDIGSPINRMAKEGDYIKIDIPGPGSKSGDGYDWVHVEAVEETSLNDVESIGIRVRPAPKREKLNAECSASTAKCLTHYNILLLALSIPRSACSIKYL